MLLFSDLPSRNHRCVRQEEHATSCVLHPRTQVAHVFISLIKSDSLFLKWLNFTDQNVWNIDCYWLFTTFWLLYCCWDESDLIGQWFHQVLCAACVTTGTRVCLCNHTGPCSPFWSALSVSSVCTCTDWVWLHRSTTSMEKSSSQVNVQLAEK